MWLTGRRVRAPRGRNRPTPCSPPHTPEAGARFAPRGPVARLRGGNLHAAGCGPGGRSWPRRGRCWKFGPDRTPPGVQPPRATPPTRQPTHGLQVTPWVPRPVGLACFPASRLGRSRFVSRAQQTRGPANAPSRALLPLPETHEHHGGSLPPPQDILSVPCSGPSLPLPAQGPLHPCVSHATTAQDPVSRLVSGF